MKLNFKGFFKAAGLFPLALMLSGCISYALVSHTAKGSSGKYQSQSDTITGLSQAKDSNGTKGYVFVGESLDYLITDGADDIVKMLNDPALNRHNIQVADDARGNDSNLLIVFYVQIMPDDFVMQLHRF